jgi:signal transduction histidine kinase
MNSLRRRLALALLLGFALLLGAGGSAVYYFTRAALTQQFDQALLGKATTLTGLVRQRNGKIEVNIPDRVMSQPGMTRVLDYFQVWEIHGGTLQRSFSLASADLPRRYGPLQNPDVFDLELPGGIPARAVGLRYSLGLVGANTADAPQVGLVAAMSRFELDEQISALAYILIGTGGVALLVSLFMVDIILWGGLARLQRLADQAGEISAGTLQRRFPTDGLTVELAPIARGLNDLLARLEKSFRELNHYAGKVAHELRTPLAILRLKIEQGGGRIAPELAEELQDELHQLGHVVEQSLLIARAEQGRVSADLKPFDLAALVAEVAEDFALIATDGGRQVKLTGEKNAAPVLADAKHTRQIVHNLLTNAWKHGRGDIWLEVRPARHAQMLSIINQVLPRPAAAGGLGLGLRVVDSLLALQPGVRCRRRSGAKYYAVRLKFPATEQRSA